MTTSSVPSIDQLRELPLPASPFSYMPQTWGWLVLLLILLAAVGVWLVLLWRRWQRDGYRREALARLAVLERSMAHPAQRVAALRELPDLFKRVALSSPAGQAAATLTGPEWQAFLSAHAMGSVPDDLSARLFKLAYTPDQQVQALPEADVRDLVSACRHWIEVHHVAV